MAEQPPASPAAWPGPPGSPDPARSLARPWALRNYALLADGERGALVDPDGAVVWLCAPRWDDEAVFSRLLGGRGGYRLAPEDDWRVWGGYYQDGTLIWVSRWVSGSGIVESEEALARPAGPGRAVLLRRVHARRGDAAMSVRLDVRPGFGRHRLTELRERDGCWTGRAGPLHVRVHGLTGVRPDAEGELAGRFLVPEGRTHDVVLEIADREHTDPLDPGALWAATRHAWDRDVPSCDDTEEPRDARQAYALLRGLTSGAGGMVAAATTALPERAQAGRNYDYRYAWIRDQCYAGLAVAAHGPHPLLDTAVRFTTERVLADGPELRPLYTVRGGHAPPEKAVGLPGYPGGSDRVGNRARHQFQLDAFGEVLQLHAAAARLGRLDAEGRRACEVAAKAVMDRWREPDAGVWELEERWWTHSRLSVVAGLRAAADALGGTAADDWRAAADHILRETRRRCLHPDGHWQRAEDDEGMEAALLMAFARGALEPRDPTAVRTRQEIRDRLAKEGYLYRFQHGDTPLGQAEGAFTLCGFMMVLAADSQGDRSEALRWWERIRSAAGTPGLFAEEYDVLQRQLRGNFPQAFVHALLLESGVRLARPPRS